MECWDVEVWVCGFCSAKGHFPLLRHQVSKTKALSFEQQHSKEQSPSNVTGEIKEDFHHLYKVLLVYCNTPTHTPTLKPIYFLSMRSHTEDEV